MKKSAFIFLFFISLLITATECFANFELTEVLFDKDYEANPELAKEYPIKICVGTLGYSHIEAKTQDDPKCQQQKEIPYEQCMKQRKGRANFKLLVINNSINVQPGDVIYLKRKAYSFVMGASGFQKNFSKEKNSTFKIDTANYGGVTIDPLKNCKRLKVGEG